MSGSNGTNWVSLVRELLFKSKCRSAQLGTVESADCTSWCSWAPTCALFFPLIVNLFLKGYFEIFPECLGG